VYLPINEVYGLCFQLLCAVQVSQNEDVGYILYRQTVAESLLT